MEGRAKIVRMGEPSIPRLGVFMWEGIPSLLTLELPWKENQPMISCIPEGEYVCKRTRGRTTSGGHVISITYEVMDVPNRSGILFHIGNSLKDTNGCILTALKFNPKKDIRWYLLQSNDGFQKFLNLANGVPEFKLTIISEK